MESILLGHIYHMINNNYITGHTVKNKIIARHMTQKSQ